MIDHAIPGRLRLRHEAPLSESALQELVAKIRAIAPSATIDYSTRTNRTLVCFDEKDQSGRVRELFARASSDGVFRQGCACKLRWPSMRRVKQGMGLSLMASLGLLAARSERGHAVAGSLFLGFLARHVWVYRKRVWK